MRRFLICFLLPFVLLPAAYGQKNKTGIVLAEGLTKDASVIVKETVEFKNIRFYEQYITPQMILRTVVAEPLRRDNISFSMVANRTAFFNDQAVSRAILREAASHHFEQLAMPPQLEIPLEELPVFSKAETDSVIFDLDGTLLDSLGVWEHSGTNFLRSQGIEPPADLDAELAQLSLKDGALLMKGMYHLPQSVEEIMEATLRPIKEHYYNDIPVKAKVPALLEHLKSQGIKMAVATAGSEDFARAALSRLGLLDYFKFIITCDEVGVGKRKARVYEMALVRLGGVKRRTVVVEDAPYALQTAHKAQFRTVGVWDAHHARKMRKIQRNTTIFVSFD